MTKRMRRAEAFVDWWASAVHLHSGDGVATVGKETVREAARAAFHTGAAWEAGRAEDEGKQPSVLAEPQRIELGGTPAGRYLAVEDPSVKLDARPGGPYRTLRVEVKANGYAVRAWTSDYTEGIGSQAFPVGVDFVAADWGSLILMLGTILARPVGLDNAVKSEGGRP